MAESGLPTPLKNISRLGLLLLLFSKYGQFFFFFQTTNQYRISKLGLRSDAYFTSKDSRHRWCCIRSLRVAANHWLMWATFIINQLQGYDGYEASFCFLFINLKKNIKFFSSILFNPIKHHQICFISNIKPFRPKSPKAKPRPWPGHPNPAVPREEKTVANLQDRVIGVMAVSTLW